MNYKWNIEFENVGVVYPNGYEALKNINLKIPEGNFVAIIGLSGAGKTTLLKTINKINNITSGHLFVGDKSTEAIDSYKKIKDDYEEVKVELAKLKATNDKKNDINKNNPLVKKFKAAKAAYKVAKSNKPYYSLKLLKGAKAREYKTHIGMIFQRYNLIYKSSVINNVIAARLSKMNPFRGILGIPTKKDKDMAYDALAQVNILETAYVRAEELSGGQMQRVALARTIVQEARIILADEPVGALDPIMAKSVMDSFHEINTKQNKTIITNLHHVDLALQYADRIIGVRKGEIVYDGAAEKVNINVLKTIYGKQLEGFDEHELKEIKRKRKLVKGK